MKKFRYEDFFVIMKQKKNSQPKTPIEIFHLQYFFAKRISEILQTDLETALIDWTPLWFSVGAQNTENKKSDEIWSGLIRNFDINLEDRFVQRAYELYSKRDVFPYVFGFGCFEYSVVSVINEEKYIKISFLNNDHGDNLSPLDRSKFITRKKELKTMFQHIKENQPDVYIVQGESWIYSLHNYRELFPKQFIKNLQISEPNYRYSIWSQFQDFKGKSKDEMIQHFKNRLESATNIEEIHDAWYFKTHKTRCDIKYFYKHFGIE